MKAISLIAGAVLMSGAGLASAGEALTAAQMDGVTGGTYTCSVCGVPVFSKIIYGAAAGAVAVADGPTVAVTDVKIAAVGGPGHYYSETIAVAGAK